MKVTYYEIYDDRYDSIPKELENRKFSSFEGAIKALKVSYKPFRNCGENLICDLDELVIYGQETQQVITGYKKFRGSKKEPIPIYETETYTKVVKDYSEYNTNKSGFYRGDNTKKGYFITKLGEVQETIDIKESQISWKAPAFVQFWSAERKYSPEVKQEGLPYSPAKSEVINELAISEWLPVYYTPRGNFSSRDKYYIDRLSCGQWEVCCDYTLTDSFRISKVEIEIEDTI